MGFMVYISSILVGVNYENSTPISTYFLNNYSFLYCEDICV